MSSHAANYGLAAPFHTIALFGANGQISEHILHALVSSKRPGHEFTVVAFIQPGTRLQDQNNVVIKTFDVEKATRGELSKDLKGVDVIVSALNGPALEGQTMIQDAAADAGVKRFYPSEYGFHQIYRKPNDPMGYIHPAWNMKAK
ncbi:isoflavone reductase family protein [Pyrenophora tritici-repentis]|uniref:Isoflavone reductase family protein n=1 Tax=Pyrenophora tritici-repentis TaxID=45151 RepID=A0A2W1G2B8_9PLEO|nr:isoflavone reductase family protein [Pyrenophora tritici-repentis]KAI1517850.1 isoflavone reductase family protein [Pyrenophora tritici-repentis]PZD04650.1 NmrA multi-domain protein [Pyrenophora tritici-repentis]PZD27037.1 NmrA multi-domain protein [Pyrenophora tritici-repentis]PZD38122.1 NmrA multi-domain protein [Pyrenophora tritici-repentis]